MRFLILVTTVFFSAAIFAEQEPDTITLKVPPKEMAKWYKPANKRQVWLHTMFRLRREMQAMAMYAEKAQQKDLEKWAGKFSKDYKSIAEMIPQWQSYLYLDKLKKLEKSVNERDYVSISAILKKIGKSCMSCHDDYQTVTTLLYRTSDFNNQSLSIKGQQEKIDYDDMMGQLSDSVNLINIAIKDGYFADAQSAVSPLKQQLGVLADNCVACHGKDNVPVERIMSASNELLPELEVHLQNKEQKQAGRKLGEFAVKVCARCHSIHRLTSDLKNQLE